MKQLIAVWGVADRGKTQSIRRAYELLRCEHPDATVGELNREGAADIACVIAVKGVRIGIESRGDPGRYVRLWKQSLLHFAKVGCQIIICSTRSRGASVHKVQDFGREHGYSVD